MEYNFLGKKVEKPSLHLFLEYTKEIMKKSVDETTLEFFIDKLKHTLLINIQTSRLQISNAYLSELCEELFEKAFLYKYEEKNNENNKS